MGEGGEVYGVIRANLSRYMLHLFISFLFVCLFVKVLVCFVTCVAVDSSSSFFFFFLL